MVFFSYIQITFKDRYYMNINTEFKQTARRWYLFHRFVQLCSRNIIAYISYTYVALRWYIFIYNIIILFAKNTKKEPLKCDEFWLYPSICNAFSNIFILFLFLIIRNNSIAIELSFYIYQICCLLFHVFRFCS